MEKTDPRIDIARNNLRMAVTFRRTSLSATSVEAGMARNGLSQFVTGRTGLTYANMLRTCDALNLPIGVIHRADAITENRIRLYQRLERLPEHKLQQALDAVEA
ncbi:hypothetical protein ETW23_03795 [Leisingera sp. NJS201]|uniref:hypothetical protein n=1 Tax=Leisingera sp. NJS201 TaxID=2508306 RepID=UPI001070F4CB|nr:hypothetical protein [Leisingera sp. NJS201]QBR35389.1 hypothetical protein ETW23_03795 [Leisingera sp. NJS201]